MFIPYLKKVWQYETIYRISFSLQQDWEEIPFGGRRGSGAQHQSGQAKGYAQYFHGRVLSGYFQER